MDEFEVDVSKWVAKVRARQGELKRALGEAEVTRLKELTPVVTGNMRARWHVESIDDDHIEIVNDAVYARRVNSGFVGKDSLGRNYHQSGAHMVEQTMLETPEIAKKVVEDLS